MPKPLLPKWKFMEDDLFIKPSLILGAGKGLFTKVYIEKEDIVTEFTGEKISHTVSLARFLMRQSHSLVHLNATYCIDSCVDKKCLATFINDAKGILRVPYLRNNVKLVSTNGRLFVIAIKNIKAGDELYLGYGKEYWQAMKNYKILERPRGHNA
ncbi:MAG: SET domain-containing protein-lysine N-methyltransferase [Bacteroidota bacterium]